MILDLIRSSEDGFVVGNEKNGVSVSESMNGKAIILRRLMNGVPLRSIWIKDHTISAYRYAVLDTVQRNHGLESTTSKCIYKEDNIIRGRNW